MTLSFRVLDWSIPFQRTKENCTLTEYPFGEILERMAHDPLGVQSAS